MDKLTYGKERDEVSKSLVARFNSQSIILGPQERSDDTLLANLEDGLRGIFESPRHRQSLQAIDKVVRRTAQVRECALG